MSGMRKGHMFLDLSAEGMSVLLAVPGLVHGVAAWPALAGFVGGFHPFLGEG